MVSAPLYGTPACVPSRTWVASFPHGASAWETEEGSRCRPMARSLSLLCAGPSLIVGAGWHPRGIQIRAPRPKGTRSSPIAKTSPFQGPRSLAFPPHEKRRRKRTTPQNEVRLTDPIIMFFFSPPRRPWTLMRTRLMGSLPNSSADSFACHRAFPSHHFPQFVVAGQTSEQPTFLVTKRARVSDSLA